MKRNANPTKKTARRKEKNLSSNQDLNLTTCHSLTSLTGRINKKMNLKSLMTSMKMNSSGTKRKSSEMTMTRKRSSPVLKMKVQVFQACPEPTTKFQGSITQWVLKLKTSRVPAP